MSRREVWQELGRRFQGYEHLRSPTWLADRPRSPARRILDLLSLGDDEHHRYLVTGTIGTGKTTELLRICEARKGQDLVVFLDLARHFHLLGHTEGLQRVSSWEVCFLVGLLVYRTAEEQLSFPFSKEVLKDLESAWKKLAYASEIKPPPQIDLGKLAKAMVSAGGMIFGASAPIVGLASEAFHKVWDLPMGAARKGIPDDAEPAKTMLDVVNHLIGEVQGASGHVLLVIDGLDRIHDLERARELFIDSEMLGRLACHAVVLCGPFALHHNLMTATVPRFQHMPLVNEPVLDRRDPARTGPGLAFFTDLFVRRTKDLGGTELVAQPLIDHLAFYSGGRARGFVKLIHGVAQEVRLARADAATPEIVEIVLDEQRLLYETGLHKGHIDVLEGVMHDPAHRLPHSELVWELLSLSRLLPYRDHSEWFYPQPLLTRHLLRRAG
jgi:hypothetical protein